MEVTEFGMVTEVNPIQPSKADPPMEVTELGMVTEVNPLHLPKAALPIEVTEYVIPLWVTEEGMVSDPVGNVV